MIRQVIFHTGTGAYIADSIVADDSPPPLVWDSTHDYITVDDIESDMSTKCVDPVTLEMIDRAAMPLLFFPPNRQVPADGVSELVVTGIPDGVVVVATLPEGQVVEEITGGVVTIVSGTPGAGTLSFLSNIWVPRTQVEIEFV